MDARMTCLTALRVAFGGLVVAWAALGGSSLLPLSALAVLAAGYAVLAVLGELGRRLLGRHGGALVVGLLVADGAFLAATSFVTGGLHSPIRSLVLVHVVAAVLLLGSVRGMAVAAWHGALLVAAVGAQLAGLVPVVDLRAGQGIGRMPIVELCAFAAFAAATALASAVADRDRRWRQEEQLALAEIHAKLGDVDLDEVADERPRTPADRALAAELRRAVELDELRLAFQPVVALGSGRIAGLEALVRWEHPERGPLSPADFLDIAELDGTILPIGRWVLRRACEQTALWRASGAVPPDLFVAVNVSGREVRAPGFVGAVEEALAWSGMQPARLVLEVSEAAFARRTKEIVAVLEEIRALGVRVAIDDFGTGSLALRHLAHFPLDAVKIAGRLSGAPDRDPMSAALAEAIVAVGSTLHVATVAERIESEEHATRMRDLGCTYGQGYFFAPPLSVAEIDAGVEGLATDHRWRPVRPAPSRPPATVRQAPRLLEPIRQPTAA